MAETFVIKEKEDGSVIYLHDVQMKILEILKEFDRICKANNIEYALSYGTVLGAVRHSGFIPWDDDVDVLMDYKNYNKLVKVLEKEVKAPFYFHCNETDDLYNATICEMKFRIDGTKVVEKNFLLKNRCEGNGLFIDVFIMDSVSESTKPHSFVRFYSMILAGILVFTDLLGFKMAWLKKKYRNIGRKYADKNSDSSYVGIQPTWVYDGFKDDRVERDVVFPFSELEFEGYSFPVPGDYHQYCEKMYGPNYMEFPPLEQQKPKHISDISI